jgi:hypothetical protein
MKENTNAAPLLPSSGSVSPRGLMVALFLGSLPALAAWFLDEKALQPWDLAVAAGVLALAAVYLLRKAPVTVERIPIFTAVLVAAVPALIVMFSHAGPVTNDERAVVLQAEIMAEGRLSEPLVTSESAAVAPYLADAFRRRQIFEDPESGTRFSKYAPGTSLALTPATLLGQPLLATLCAAFLNLALIFLIARALGLASPAIAVLLLATSPFFLLVHTSVQSEVFTTPAVLCGYLAFLHARAQNPKWALLLGLSAGWVFVTRPLTGLVFALVAGLLLAVHRDRLKTVPFAIVGGLPMLALALWWNHRFTGSATTSVYELYASTFGPFFPGPERLPQDVYGNGDFFGGLLRQSGRWAVAFGGMLGAIGLGLWGSFRLRQRDGGLVFLFALLLPAAYSLHWYAGHRAYLGPLYLFETLGLLLCGLLFLLEQAPLKWRNALLLAMVSLGGVVFAFRWELINEESQLRSAPQRAVAEILGEESNAVIFLPKKYKGSREKAFKYWTPSRPQDLAGSGAVILRTSKQLTPAALVAELGLQERPLYRFEPNVNGTVNGSLVPLELTAPQR